VLNSLDWKWDNEGALITVQIDGSRYMVHVPLKVLHIEFGKSFGAIGCPVDGGSVGGFFSSIKRAIKKVVPKSIQRAVNTAASAVKRVATKVVQPVLRGASKVLNNSVVKLIASNIPLVSTGYNWARTGLAAANTGLSLLTNPSLKTLGRGVFSAVSGPDLEYQDYGVGLVTYVPTLDEGAAPAVGYHRQFHRGTHLPGQDGRRLMAYRPMWRPNAVPAGW
jgi:hypothetical protein